MHENKLVDLFSGLFLLTLSVVMYISTFSFRQLTASKIGSAFVPQIVAIGLFILSLILTINAFVQWKKEKQTREETVEKKDSIEKPSYSLVIISLILMGVYLFTMPTIGFLISTAVYLFIQIYLIAPSDKRNPIPFAIVSIVTSTIIYFVFKNVFYLMLPSGILG
ncbi:tripartite tricarboxylate transporter TctB family protein [Gracilibacillus dipsosauri]|uniref:tripartite tricarboxylate transporter TctB family protein n=1 Tax=Gracilibacillus dipsosauri TaxID=178340 RepID=UPI00240955DE